MDTVCRSFRVRNTLLLLACISLTACDIGERSSASTLVWDSAGIQVVENLHVPEQVAVVWEIDPEPAVRIGTIDGPETEQLFGVRGAVRLSDGRVAVLNAGTQELRYYSADGSHLASVGGRGAGPGEFQAAGRMRRLAEDTIVVWDAARQTQSWFGPEGQFIRSRLAQRGQWEGLFGPDRVTDVLTPLPDGSLLLRVRSLLLEAPLGWNRPALGLARTDPDDLSDVDSLGWYLGLEHYNVGTESQPLMRSVPYFARTTHIAAGGKPMRIFVGGMEDQDTNGYDIDVFRPDGSLERIIRHAIPRQGVRDEDLELARENERRTYESSPVQRSEEWIAEQVSALPTPETVPPHAELLVDADGNLWVQEWNASPSTRRHYRIFAPDGAFQGLVECPEGLRIFEAGSDYVLGIWRDESDVEFIQVHQVEKGT